MTEGFFNTEISRRKARIRRALFCMSFGTNIIRNRKTCLAICSRSEICFEKIDDQLKN